MKNEARAGERDGQNLFRATLPFLIVIAIQAVLATASVEALSIVRAYVGGESLWTKGQKDAIYYLSLYAELHDDAHYRKFRRALAGPLGDRSARRAMEQEPPRLDEARSGFLAGGNAPADVPGMIVLFTYGRNIPYFADAVAQWRATDALLDDFSAVGESTRRDIVSGEGEDRRLELTGIEQLNERMTPLAVAFSDALGAGSRAIAALIIAANIGVGGLLYALIFWRMRKHLRQRRNFTRALAAERERAAATLEEIGEAVFRVDSIGRIRYCNPAALALVNAGREALGKPLGEFVKLVDLASGAPLADLAATLLADPPAPGQRRSGLALLRRSDRIPITLVHTRVVDEEGESGAVLVLHDMSNEQAMIERLAHLAAHDHLTGLANRREFERSLGALLSGVRPVASHAIVVIDLDRFKEVNDSGGHAAGDALLGNTAALLRANVRPGDLVARLGGDEFGAVLIECTPEEAAEVAERLRSALQRAAFMWGRRRYGVTGSLGVVAVAPGVHALEAVLHAADEACYRAKARGRNRVELSELPADRSPDGSNWFAEAGA